MKKTILAFCLLPAAFMFTSCGKSVIPDNISEIEIFEKQSVMDTGKLWSYAITDTRIIKTFVGDLTRLKKDILVDDLYFVLLKSKKREVLLQTDGTFFKYQKDGGKARFFYLDEPLSIESFKKSAQQ